MLDYLSLNLGITPLLYWYECVPGHLICHLILPFLLLASDILETWLRSDVVCPQYEGFRLYLTLPNHHMSLSIGSPLS